MTEMFNIKFYKWSQEYFKNEIVSNFPILRQLDIVAARWLVKEMDSLSHENKLLLGSGLVKRQIHYETACFLNDTGSSEENKLIEWYLDRGHKSFATGVRRKMQTIATGNLLARKDIRKIVLGTIKDKLGIRGNSDVPNDHVFESNYDGVIVRTYICLNGKPGDLTYYHEVLSIDRIRIATSISILSWLGISGGGTTWEALTRENVDTAAHALELVCSEFLSAMSQLVRNL